MYMFMFVLPFLILSVVFLALGCLYYYIADCIKTRTPQKTEYIMLNYIDFNGGY